MNEIFIKYGERNKNINRGFRKLDVWKEAIDLFAIVKKKLNEVKNISLKTKGQIEDSILSGSSNIAEGYSRRFLKENIQFNSVALASLAENYSQLFALLNSNDIDEGWFKIYDDKHYCLENKLINLNKTLIDKLKNDDNWKNDYQVKELNEIYGLKEAF